MYLVCIILYVVCIVYYLMYINLYLMCIVLYVFIVSPVSFDCLLTEIKETFLSSFGTKREFPGKDKIPTLCRFLYDSLCIIDSNTPSLQNQHLAQLTILNMSNILTLFNK